MDRAAVFVDAGYLFAQGLVAFTGKKLPRGNLRFDSEEAAKALADVAARIVNLPLLRIYWYDGRSTGPTSQHLSLARLAGIKVRLGYAAYTRKAYSPRGLYVKSEREDLTRQPVKLLRELMKDIE